MDLKLLYTASVISIIGAVALWRLIRPGGLSWRIPAAVLALAAFVGLLANVGLALAGESRRPEAFFTIFSVIAIASGVRMITHHKPVYSALYFVLVVLSSAALFLLLEAEFMAFALVIVYAGAILITYMFVLMLAQQTGDPGQESGAAEYDVNPREPTAAAVVGFIMLALLSSMIYDGVADLPVPSSAQEARVATWRALDAMPARQREIIARVAPDAQTVFDEQGRMLRLRDGRASIEVIPSGSNQRREIELGDEYMPSNVELVGLDLIAKFPVSLELAGVILLMAMYGAVILARRQIELGEDEVREAAGLPRASFEALDIEGAGPSGGSGPSGASGGATS
jgi:NADH-quinone oxidoreductase subunit J